MRVADLQQFVRSLIGPMRAAGASARVVDDLEATAGSLEPFGALGVGEFAALLGRARQYEETGILPVAAGVKGKKAAAAKAPALGAAEALALVEALYTRATDEGVTFSQIDAETARLDKLKKNELDQVARDFGVSPGKTKPLSLESIRRKIKEYKEGYQRIQF